MAERSARMAAPGARRLRRGKGGAGQPDKLFRNTGFPRRLSGAWPALSAGNAATSTQVAAAVPSSDSNAQPAAQPTTAKAAAPREPTDAMLAAMLRDVIDPAWYCERYPDVAGYALGPVEHFIRHGAQEARDPNKWFNGAWYSQGNPDVGASGLSPILHYLRHGAVQLRNPHQSFDAAWYVAQHPEAADNPLLFHMRTGRQAGWATGTGTMVDWPAGTRSSVRPYVDAAYYLERYPDVAAGGMDPVEHFVVHGAQEGRAPNPWFDPAWYREWQTDVDESGLEPVLHYVLHGEAQLRNPHPDFDAAWYVEQHPEAGERPLRYHMQVGRARGWATSASLTIQDYLPATTHMAAAPTTVAVDVVIPVYRGLAQTRRCIQSVLIDPLRPPGRIIVVDDRSPEPELSAWLADIAKAGSIVLLRNEQNLGFVRSVNLGIAAAGAHDVVLLNSDTEVPAGWLRRLAAHAYAHARVASVSPFSNNATICSYPRDSGGPIALGLALPEMDAVTAEVNAGRHVTVPTTVGFCMYLRREALADVGVFDAETFGHGYGEENDFCCRARQRGWQHLLACDVFVYHEGSVSFGAERSPRAAAALESLTRLYPHYLQTIASHVARDSVGPYRFALTAALFRRSGLPTILMVSHDLGGGVQQHIETLRQGLEGRANFLVLGPDAGGIRLSVPGLHEHPVLKLPANRLDELVVVLRSAAVSRVHIHHLARMTADIRSLIHRLAVPFDYTVHDYFAICPQINLLPWSAGSYCGEPGPATCNACIAANPAYRATDIHAWRREQAWPFLGADRVICPSQDVHDRLARFGLAGRAIVRPHEPVAPGAWKVAPPPLAGGRLRVALLGSLANHKGAHVAAGVAMALNQETTEVRLIGHTFDGFPRELRSLLAETGRFSNAELPSLLRDYQPHVVWLPATWPETYSFTLSAAIDAGLPIIASDIGVFPERLAGRPLTWLVPPHASTAEWLAAFEAARAALEAPRPSRRRATRAGVADFYQAEYLPPPAPKPRGKSLRVAPAARKAPYTRLRRPGRLAVVIIPERLDNGVLSPCAYIRLIQPFDHPAIGQGLDLVIADAATALDYDADCFITQRYAMPDQAAGEALATHVRALGAALIYDIDDNLLDIPADHPEAEMLLPRAPVVRRMLALADAVWVSTPALAAALPACGGPVRVIENGLDERIWCAGAPLPRPRLGPTRLLYMGTATHDAGLEIVAPALERLVRDFSGQVEVDIIGVTGRAALPGWARRPIMSENAWRSYPGFVNWLTQQPAWDIGLAPLPATPFNLAKSALKTLDYAALNLAVVASDVPTYHGSLADGPGGLLVENTTAGWYAALSELVRDAARRGALAARAHAALLAQGTLARQAEARLQALLQVRPGRGAG